MDPAAQLVLCAGQPDTPELAAEVEGLVAELRAARSGVIWIPEMLPKRAVIQLLTHPTVLACPSLYDPLAIANLEAMPSAPPPAGPSRSRSTPTVPPSNRGGGRAGPLGPRGLGTPGGPLDPRGNGAFGGPGGLYHTSGGLHADNGCETRWQ